MTELYPIEAGIPIPGVSHDKYRFGRLQIGDSFPVSYDEIRNVRAAASSYGAQHQKKFTVRRRVKNDDHSYRCWRTE